MIFFGQTRLADIPPAQRSMRFEHIDWNRAIFRTLREAFGYLVVNFNRVWVIHVSVRFYTACNTPTICYPRQCHSSALTWSATALEGAVAAIIMILAALAEFSYIPPHALVTFSPSHPSSYGWPYLLHRHCGELARRWISALPSFSSLSV